MRKTVEMSCDYIPDFEDLRPISPSPNANDILPIPDTENDAADIVDSLAELVTNNGQEQILPVTIRDPLLKTDNPLAALLVLIILPYWPDALLEKMVVGYQRQVAGALQVPVYAEECLDRVTTTDRVQGLFVLDEAVGLRDGWAEPEHPTVT